VQAACDAAWPAANTRCARSSAMPPTRAGYPSDDLNEYIEDVSGPIVVLENVHPDQAIRDAAQACALRMAGLLPRRWACNEKVSRPR
jgi:thimet oligopeptidase